MTIPAHRPPSVSDRLGSEKRSFRTTASARSDLDRVLNSSRRRGVLRYLLETGGPIELRTLVGRLADAENDPTVETPLLEQRQRVYVSLCQTHLPALEESDLVTYDRLRALVAPGSRLVALDSRLESFLES